MGHKKFRNKPQIIPSPAPTADPTAIVLILTSGFLLYLKTLFANFTYLDDNTLILNNQIFLRNLGNIPAAFLHGVFPGASSGANYYRPLLTLSFMFDAALGGAAPFIYHLDNLVIHLIACLLVYKLFLTLKFSRKISLVTALIFTVHPVLSQAIGWIPGRNDSLLTVFVLVSFLSYLSYLSNLKNRYLVIYSLGFAAAIFTKETGILVPIICLAYQVLIIKSFKNLLVIGNWLLVIPIVILWFILRHHALGNSPIPFTSIIANMPATLQMLGKIFFPFNLTVMPIIRDTTYLYGFISLIGLISLIGFSLGKQLTKWLLFGFMWFLMFLLPSFIRPDSGAPADFIEHRLYLPIIGIFIILAKLAATLKLPPKVSVILIILVISVLSILNFFHTEVFSDRLTFWHEAVIGSPHLPLAHRNLGAMYYLDGQLDRAAPEYQAALALNPTEPMAHNNLGLIYDHIGNYQAAVTEYLAELKNNPNYDDAHFNLGLTYYHQGEATAAAQEWRQTLLINPDYEDAKEALKQRP